MINRFIFRLFFLFFLAITNYQVAVFVQKILSPIFPFPEHIFGLSFCWLVLCGIPVLLTAKNSGISLQNSQMKKNWQEIFLLSGFVIAGLNSFMLLGITEIFQAVRYPFFFFLVTPIAEELLFRGYIFGQLKKMFAWPLAPVIGSALFFGLHHLQYFSYRPSLFALFQILYTIILGLIFGRLRQKSGFIYPSLFLHIFINWATILL
jgi:membrane protease YdiL (CAAX protease family)